MQNPTFWKNTLWVALGAIVFAGCVSPLHLTYDYGRAYTESIVKQADLTRPSVAELNIWLYGEEAEKIRIQAEARSTDKETGQTQLGGP